MNVNWTGGNVEIELDGAEVADAINAWLDARGVQVSGRCTVLVNGGLCKDGRVSVDPSGSVIASGTRVGPWA